MAESLLGMLGAFRAVRALGRSGRVARQRAVVHHLRHPGALGAAALPPCRVQQAVRRRHHGVAAFGHPRCALRQCSAGVVLRYPLLHDLYLRARRELDRACLDLCADPFRDLRRPGAFPDDVRPLGRCRMPRHSHPRRVAELYRDARTADLHRHTLPLHGQDPRYVVFARGRGGLSGIRVHTAGPRGQGVAAVVAETHVRLVLRPFQPGVVAYAAAVLDRRPASYERIRAYRTARIPACLRRADDALRAVVPLAPYRALPVRRPGGVRLLCGSGLPACARTATHSDRLAGAPCRPCGKTA